MIHKLIRRSDAILTIDFSGVFHFLKFTSDNPINGEGLGFIISSKYWETFNIIRFTLSGMPHFQEPTPKIRFSSF